MWDSPLYLLRPVLALVSVTASLRQLLLPTSVLANLAAPAQQGLEHADHESGKPAGVAAYAPGGTGSLRHLRIHPPVPSWHGGRMEGLSSRGASPVALAPKMAGEQAGLPKGFKHALQRFPAADQLQAVPAPAKAPVQATKIIKDWMNAAETAEMAAGKNDPRKSFLMHETDFILHKMQTDLATGTPDYVFALATDMRADDVHALATVTFKEKSFGAEVMQLAYIDKMAARPTADRLQGAGAELVRKIADWAATIDHLVTICPYDEPLLEYYQRIGFEVVESPCLVYAGYGSERSSLGRELHMISLEKPSKRKRPLY